MPRQQITSFGDIPSFVDAAEHAIGRAASNVRLADTKENRLIRRFSLAEVATFIGCDRSALHGLLKHPDAPPGDKGRGRERTFSIHDALVLRAIAHARPAGRMRSMFWREPGDPLPVIVFSSQKGGTGKSLSSAHFLQHLCLNYGLRGALIDADPQATGSLYMVDSETAIAGYEVETFTDFMGVPDPGITMKIEHDPARLDTFFRRTPWPGLRLIPGGASIQEADIAMYYLTQSGNAEQRRIYRMLRDAIGRWADAHPPRTRAADLIGADGRFRADRFEAALYETLDVIVIDTPPSLSLATLNTIVAADSMVIPATMKGFDLSTLHIYLSSLNDYFRFIRRDANPVRFAPSQPFILPTIVGQSSDTDIRTIGEIYAMNPEIISPVYYRYSAGAANAFREFKSAYEYVPERERKASMAAFVANANAVNDAIVTRALPHLPTRGYARAFVDENYPEGAVPLWCGGAAEGAEVAA